MKFLISHIFIGLLSFSGYAQNSEDTTITTIYFIRHAEKDRSNPENTNPHLAAAGNARAKHWAEILQHVKFDAVYATNYNRTIETGLPTAENNNLTIQFYDANILNHVKILADNKGKTLLIVGHSNTTPAFVNKFLGKEIYKDIDDSNNGNLYRITVWEQGTTDLLLTINP